MKRIWFCVIGSATLLSGCAPMMYGSNTAPVVRLNQEQLQPQQPRVQSVPLNINNGQAVPLTPTYAAPPRAVRPGAVPQPPVNTAPNTPYGTQVAESSPYAQPGTAQPYQPQNGGSGDGWAVAPQSAPAQQNQATAATPAQSGAQPVRPDTNTQGNNQTPPSNTAQNVPNNPPPAAGNTAQPAAPANNNQQVASSTPPQQPAAPEKGKSAVSVLIDKASASLGKGDLDGAAAYLENAQRIEPQNVKILYDIANIRYHQGRYKDAETFAGRAVGVGGGSAMMQKTWKLISLSRSKLGDNQGAVAAAEKAASFGN